MIEGLVAEVILADCGSADITSKIADESGAIVVSNANATKADQLNAAAKQAKGQWLLCIEAKASLSEGWTDHARGHIKDHSGTSATFSRAKASVIALAVQGFVELLPVKRKISITDGILIPSSMFRTIGGFCTTDTPVLNTLPQAPRRLHAQIERQSA